MKTNTLLSAKATILTIFLLLGISRASIGSSFIASFNGSWSSPSSWGGNNPGFNVAGGNNVTIPAGVTVILDSDLTVDGYLNLEGGTLNLNGQNLTVNGAINTTGLGSIIGNVNSNVVFSGYGGAGNIVFAPGSQVINSLTVNIGANSGIFLGSGLTVSGTLSLVNGYLGIGDNNLVISEKGNIQGGSASNYIITNGTGSLTIAVPATGTPYIFQVGTQNNYAPVAVTNNSDAPGMFSVSAIEGVLTNGNTGSDMCNTQSMVNTSWNISSTLRANADVSLEMFWNTNMQVNGFNNAQAYASQYTTDGWNTNDYTTATANNNGSFSLKLAGVTSFSQYAVFGKNTATGIKNIAADPSFSLYPNPASGVINLSVAETASFPILKIYDASGKEISSQQVENSLTTLDISNLSGGIYFASLNGATAQKFIKE
jgi:hypothetical protein